MKLQAEGGIELDNIDLENEQKKSVPTKPIISNKNNLQPNSGQKNKPKNGEGTQEKEEKRTVEVEGEVVELQEKNKMERESEDKLNKVKTSASAILALANKVYDTKEIKEIRILCSQYSEIDIVKNNIDLIAKFETFLQENIQILKKSISTLTDNFEDEPKKICESHQEILDQMEIQLISLTNDDQALQSKIKEIEIRKINIITREDDAKLQHIKNAARTIRSFINTMGRKIEAVGNIDLFCKEIIESKEIEDVRKEIENFEITLKVHIRTLEETEVHILNDKASKADFNAHQELIQTMKILLAPLSANIDNSEISKLTAPPPSIDDEEFVKVETNDVPTPQSQPQPQTGLSAKIATLKQTEINLLLDEEEEEGAFNHRVWDDYDSDEEPKENNTTSPTGQTAGSTSISTFTDGDLFSNFSEIAMKVTLSSMKSLNKEEDKRLSTKTPTKTSLVVSPIRTNPESQPKGGQENQVQPKKKEPRGFWDSIFNKKPTQKTEEKLRTNEFKYETRGKTKNEFIEFVNTNSDIASAVYFESLKDETSKTKEDFETQKKILANRMRAFVLLKVMLSPGLYTSNEAFVRNLPMDNGKPGRQAALDTLLTFSELQSYKQHWPKELLEHEAQQNEQKAPVKSAPTLEDFKGYCRTKKNEWLRLRSKENHGIQFFDNTMCLAFIYLEEALLGTKALGPEQFKKMDLLLDKHDYGGIRIFYDLWPKELKVRDNAIKAREEYVRGGRKGNTVIEPIYYQAYLNPLRF